MSAGSLYDQIAEAASNASVISLRAKLIAASARPEDTRQLVFPSTYAGVGHLCSPVREDGTHEYVLIDSTQSWANRLEEIADDPALGLPRVEVDVGGRVLSACQLPHRVYDAILRDSTLNGVDYRDSDLGRSLVSAGPADATGLLRHAPTVLLFGGWDSFAGLKTGAAKWPAALSGQIIGFDALLAKKGGVRVDPLGITLDGFHGFKAAKASAFWTPDEADAARDDKGKPIVVKPSEVGHGNILAENVERGTWVSGIELRASLSLTRLRRYHFPVNGAVSDEADYAARALLASLAVLLVAERLSRGLDLRSGCELDVQHVQWWIRQGMGAENALAVSLPVAREAFAAARRVAADRGLAFAANMRLMASPKLLALVAASAKGEQK